jgi:D-apionolactonase
LNRNRFDYSKVDFVIYSLNPQVHASDSHTIIENIPVEEDAVMSAHTFAKHKLIHAGPVSLKPRFNPDAKPGTKENPDARFDDRQTTPLAAGWATASIKYLAEGGADSITLFESHGRAGYFSGAHKFPLYNALLAIRKLNPKKVIKTICNEPLVVTSLLIETENGKRQMILINHSDSKKFVNLNDDTFILSEHEIQFIPMKK